MNTYGCTGDLLSFLVVDVQPAHRNLKSGIECEELN